MKNTDMKIAEKLMKEGGGVLRLKPTWVPRSFCRPGKRIKLHPDDYYILGVERGGDRRAVVFFHDVGGKRPRYA